MATEGIPGRRRRAQSDAQQLHGHAAPIDVPISAVLSPSDSSLYSDWSSSWQDIYAASVISTSTLESSPPTYMQDLGLSRPRDNSFSSDASRHWSVDATVNTTMMPADSAMMPDPELLFDLEPSTIYPNQFHGDYQEQFENYINYSPEELRDDLGYTNFVASAQEHQLSNFHNSVPSNRFCHVHVSATNDKGVTIQEREEMDPHMTASSETVKLTGGRKGPLSEKSKEEANHMRKIGNCEGCRKHKNKCDPGKPCKPCINRYGPLLLTNPCRGDIAENLNKLLLDSVKWHPSARKEVDMFGPNCRYSGLRVTIPISLGFGEPLYASVHVIEPRDPAHFQHKHVFYQWPPVEGELTIPTFRVDTVFPAAFDLNNEELAEMLDRHLGSLVEKDFGYFPYFTSKFHVLSLIWGVFNHFRQVNPEYSELLKAALKLLTLVHIGGDASVDCSDLNVQRILYNYAPTYLTAPSVSCCFLRAQLGAVMPRLAAKLMRKVVSHLAALSLGKKCANFLIVNCLFALLMMTIETIQFHAAKDGVHANYDLLSAAAASSFPPSHNSMNPLINARHSYDSRQSCEEGADMLLRLYKNCFENCHAQMLFGAPDQQSQGSAGAGYSTAAPRQRSRGNSVRQKHGTTSAETVHFVSALKEAIAASGPYLEQRSVIGPERLGDMSLYFDRLLARLYLLKL